MEIINWKLCVTASGRSEVSPLCASSKVLGSQAVGSSTDVKVNKKLRKKRGKEGISNFSFVINIIKTMTGYQPNRLQVQAVITV